VIVLDASALVELVLNTAAGRTIAARIADPGLSLHVPHLADIEVAQALRQYANDGGLDAADAAVALEDLRSLDLERHAHEPLLDRVWALRHNLSAYDAVYVALAEVLDTVLLTCDGWLARAPGAVWNSSRLRTDAMRRRGLYPKLSS
jgi:predicted nucleic acid-binding protein